MKLLFSCFVTLLVVCHCSPTMAVGFGYPGGDGETYLSFTSSPQSFIGQGETVLITEGDGWHTDVFVYNPTYTSTILAFFSRGTNNWRTSFDPQGNISPGTYSFTRSGSDDDVAFTFTGYGRGANQTSGELRLYELEYENSEKNSIKRISFDFKQFEEGNSNRWIEGQLRYNSLVPEPTSGFLAVTGLLGLGIGRRRRRR